MSPRQGQAAPPHTHLIGEKCNKPLNAPALAAFYGGGHNGRTDCPIAGADHHRALETFAAVSGNLDPHECLAALHELEDADVRSGVYAAFDGAWSGLALGMGLDRMLMLLKGIPDIRVLRSAEPSVATQLTGLAPYRPVSAMPAIRRDLSVAVDRDDLAEYPGDRVRDALGPDADCVEAVEILTQTPCAELPPQALQRLGARPDQKNVLLKVVLRHLDRTLTNHDANLLRDRIYAAVHQGSAHQWAAAR